MDAQTLGFTAFTKGTLLDEEADKRVTVTHDIEYILFPTPLRCLRIVGRINVGKASLINFPVNSRYGYRDDLG